jgi:hypothetical protein
VFLPDQQDQHAWGLVEGRYFDAERLSDPLSGQQREDVAPSRIGDEYAKGRKPKTKACRTQKNW